MQTGALHIQIYIQMTQLMGTDSFTNRSHTNKTPKTTKKTKENNNNNKANLGPLKAHFLVKAGNGRFGCYILNLHVSHVIYTLDRFYVTLLYMKNKAHVGP